MSTKAKLEYVEAVRRRYLAAVFVKVIGLHGKSAIRLLHREGVHSAGKKPGRKSQYKDTELVEALMVIWQRTNLVCSKRFEAWLLRDRKNSATSGSVKAICPACGLLILLSNFVRCLRHRWESLSCRRYN